MSLSSFLTPEKNLGSQALICFRPIFNLLEENGFPWTLSFPNTYYLGIYLLSLNLYIIWVLKDELLF